MYIVSKFLKWDSEEELVIVEGSIYHAYYFEEALLVDQVGSSLDSFYPSSWNTEKSHPSRVH